MSVTCAVSDMQGGIFDDNLHFSCIYFTWSYNKLSYLKQILEIYKTEIKTTFIQTYRTHPYFIKYLPNSPTQTVKTEAKLLGNSPKFNLNFKTNNFIHTVVNKNTTTFLTTCIVSYRDTNR